METEAVDHPRKYKNVIRYEDLCLLYGVEVVTNLIYNFPNDTIRPKLIEVILMGKSYEQVAIDCKISPSAVSQSVTKGIMRINASLKWNKPIKITRKNNFPNK